MADKKSDIFGKQTATEAREARADAKADAAEAAADKKEAEQDRRVGQTQTPSPRINPSIHHQKYVDAHSVPAGQWGAAVWNTDVGSQEYPCFLDNKGEWWWATTTAQNGINPAVEKTEAPVGWRML